VNCPESLVSLDKIDKSRDGEQNCDDDGGAEEPFLHSASGVESRAEIVPAAERTAHLGACFLEEDRGDQKSGQDYLNVRKE